MKHTPLIDADVLMYRVLHRLNDNTERGAIDVYEEMQFELDKWIHECPLDLTDPIICISDSECFRKDVWPEYKANREDLPKPPYYEYGKEAVQHLDGRTVCLGRMEADDVLGMLMTSPKFRDKAVCISVDKDLLQIPGKHYNPVKKESTDITIAEGMYNRHLQWLMGDPTDNIPGIWRMGKKRAAKVLAPYFEDGEYTPIAGAAAVYNTYEEKEYDSCYCMQMYALVSILQYDNRTRNPNGYQTAAGWFKEIPHAR